MEKLYYENQYIKEFYGEIENIKEVDGKFHVVLDKTAFFPGGGGQFEDLGTIENQQVIQVYEEDGMVYHVLEKKPMKIHRVKCEIDWKRRFDGMQQHLGQHVLSGCFFKLFNANTCGFHLGNEISTVDIEGILEEHKIREAEKLANEIISNNLKVEFLTPKKSELKKIDLRRALPNTKEEIRVVKIEDLDVNACCGIHPSTTLELQAIKIRRWERHKGSTRIEYVAGGRAIADYFVKDSFTKEICRYLNANEEEAINGIKNINEQLKNTLEMNKTLIIDISNYESKEMVDQAENIGEYRVIKRIFNEDTKYVSKLVSKLTENPKVIALMAVESGDKANLIFGASKDVKLSMNELLKDAITLIDGKGGGSAYLAQGGGKNSGNLESALDYALMKIKKS